MFKHTTKSGKPGTFHRLYEFYSSGLNFQDFRKYLQNDLVWTYDFYVNRMKKPEKVRSSLHGKFLFIRNLFVGFLHHLTPVRRLLYSAAVLIFIWSYLNNIWEWAVFAVILFNILLAFELADKLMARDELSIARDTQLSLMPKSVPEHPHYQISYFCEPAKEVGGDYFDFFQERDDPGNLSIIIGDISGKGMAAALHMVQVNSIIHLIKKKSVHPKEFLCTLNSSLSGIFRNGMFFTSTYMNIFPDNSISAARGGHLPFIYYSRNSEKICSIAPKGIGLGLSENGLFSSNLEELKLNPEPGDIIVLFTDGLTESLNFENKFYGEASLHEVICSNAYKSAEQIKQCVLESVQDFSGNKPVNDDLTFIILKRV